MINEHKKNRRAVKYNIKPRNFVAKNATTGGAGEHKDKSKELPRKAKHKSKEMDMAEAGFPGAPDVEMPPMKSSGDPKRDKLKQEYMDLHREIKSLVDIQYRSTSDEEKIQAKARIKQLNDRADQIKAILEPRQPPNEWQKKTYGFDDNWNKVNQGVAEAEKKGLYYYVNKRKKAGTSRDASSPKAPTAQAWKDAAKTAKKESIAEGYLNEDIMGAPRPEDNHEASMALSELYRNAKYAMALLKIIEPNDAIDGWVQANLTNAADMLDKVGHYLDYKNINGRKPEVDMNEDDNVDDADVGEADGSMARENLQIIIEYSIRLMEMIKPGDNLASWVSMKLTKASEAVSSAKHFIEYRNFEKHTSDAFESKLTRMLSQKLSERMSPASAFAGSKKNKLGSAGQLKGNMNRPARAGDLVGGDAEESVDEQVSVDAHPTDSGDWTYSINGKPVEPGSDRHNSIKDQHMDQVSPIYKPLKQMMSQPPSQSMGADPRKDSENDVQPNDVIIPSHPKGHWVKIRDIGENDNEKPKTVAKTWDEMSSKEKLSGVKGRTVWNPKTQKYRTVFDVPAENKK